MYVYVYTAIPIIIEGRFQVFQRFSSSKLVLKTVESCFTALNYCGNGSMYMYICLCTDLYAYLRIQRKTFFEFCKTCVVFGAKFAPKLRQKGCVDSRNVCFYCALVRGWNGVCVCVCVYVYINIHGVLLYCALVGCWNCVCLCVYICI